VFLYPGQGELQVGYAQDVYEKSKSAREVFDLDPNLRDLCFRGPKEELNNPYNNQAVNFLALMALSAALAEADIKPQALAGQSLGEYAALSFAGSFSIADAIPMLRQRAQIMTDQIPAHSEMCVILGVDTKIVEKHCVNASSSNEICSIGTYATRSTHVITGSTQAVERCAKLCRDSGAKVIPVKVARAYHSPLARQARDDFRKVLQHFPITQPLLPVYYNHDGITECNDIRKMLVEQFVLPVQLVKMINTMLNDGLKNFVRIGPGGFFGDSVRNIAHERGINVKLYAIENYSDIQKLGEQLKSPEINND
jgi:[acyl-carrier-protein] S-malonyltransferase